MPSNAQTSSLGDFTIVAAYSQGEKSKPVAYLQEGLTELMKLLDVGIIYEPSLVRNIQIDKSVLTNNEGVSVETVLPIWLNNTNLTFKEVGDSGNYIIVNQAPEPTLKVQNTPLHQNRIEVSGQGQTVTTIGTRISQQQGIVQGRVVSAVDGEVLPGVSVTLVGNPGGTVTDIDGNYQLNVPSEAKSLLFSFIGFDQQEVEIGDRTTINVSLEESSAHLDEVVINALGFERSADNIGYSTSKVDGDQISKSMEGSIITGLSGKASGVQITRSSGDPGAGAHIQVRGASTIGGIQPLIVLDGIPIDNSSSGNSNGGVYQQSRLNDINPDDIETMDILKGASAAALWGSRAANGVIIITTKKGKSSDKLNLSFKSSYSVDQILNRHPLQSTFGQGDKGIYSQTSLRSWGDPIADRLGGSDYIDNTGPFFRATNGTLYYPITEKRSQVVYHDSNFDQIFQDGHFFDNSLSLSGGDSRSTFFASLSDMNQEGIARNNSDYRRTTFRVNASRKFSDIFSISTQTNYTLTKGNRLRKGNSSSGLYLGLLRNAPDFNILDYEGEYYEGPGAAPLRNRQRVYRNPLGANANPGFNNPLWTINNQDNFSKVNRFITSFQLNATPNKWLEFILRAGVDTYVDERSASFDVGSAGAIQATGTFEDEKDTDTEFNADLMGMWRPELHQDLQSELLVGFNYNERSAKSLTGSIEGFIDPSLDIDNFINGTRGNYDLSNGQSLRRNAALYSSIDLSYKDFLFGVFTGRFESASTFGEEAKSDFFFPSATLAWQFHKNINNLPHFFNFGKLRASYAIVGVEPAIYRTMNQYVAASYSDASGGTLDASRFGNGAFVPSTRVGNPFLRPEIKNEVEAGLDLRFFDNRLRTSVTYYNNRTKDVLFDVPIASSTGYTRIQDNAGEIKNNGIELDINYDLIANRDFSWTLGVLWDRNKNMISKLPDAESLDLGGLSGISGRAVQGYQLGVLWGSRWLRDENNSLILSENGFPQMDESQGVIGDPNPDWRGSALTTLRYKNLSLDVVLETSQGNDIFAGTYGALLDYGLAPQSAITTTAPQNLLTYDGQIITAGTPFRGTTQNFGAGTVALEESWYRAGGGYFNGAAEQFIQDGSWTRIQQVSLSYSFNSDKFKQKTGLQSLDLSVTGRNLFVWSEFEGNDPNTNLMGISTVRGIDYFNTPGTKSYVFTLKLVY